MQEKKNTIADESGYYMQLDEITFNQVDMKWGNYVNAREKVLSFHPSRTAIVSHFRMFDAPGTIYKQSQMLREKQFVVYREAPESYDLLVPPTRDKVRSFFELAITDGFFNSIFTEESSFMARFDNYKDTNTPSADFMAAMSPAMYSIIHDMQHAPYQGYLKGVYLEAKAIELFLMQVQQLDEKKPANNSNLTPADIESLHAIHDHIGLYYHQPCSILSLSRMAGINQMKLKAGFKELFGTTVFGYLSDVRMQEAKRLLQEEKLYVNEVADRMGYKHPHHFAAAFRRKFGVTPGSLK